jgi:hypothetical protein
MPKTMSTATEADVTGMPKAASGVNCRSASVTTLGSFGCVSQIAFCPVLGRTRAEAQAKFDQLQELVDPLAGLGSLYGTFGDLSGYPLDGPVPEDAIGKLGIRSISAQLRARVRQEKPTIRELYLRSGITGSARIGTPTDIADAMQEWFKNGACDGFNITPTHLPGGCEDFVDLVVPELQRRGLFRTEYEGKTLRENLGLKRPVSRYAAAGLDRNLDAAK